MIENSLIFSPRTFFFLSFLFRGKAKAKEAKQGKTRAG